MLLSKWAVCDSKKSKFIKEQEAKENWKELKYQFSLICL